MDGTHIRKKEIKHIASCFDPPNKRLAKRIEKSCFETAVEILDKKSISAYWPIEEDETSPFLIQYMSICAGIKINIDPESSVNRDAEPPAKNYLLNGLLNGDINPDTIGSLMPHELNPHISKHIIDEINSREGQSVVKKYTTMYQCPQCHGSKAHATEKQTRSGDEGATMFLKCLLCSKNWKIYG